MNNSAGAPKNESASPITISLLRMSLFLGLCVHFWPVFANPNGLVRGPIRTNEWNSWIFGRLIFLSDTAIVMMALGTFISCLAAAAGVATRLSSLIAGGGLFAFVSANGLGLQTLALNEAWSLILLFVFLGDNSVSLDLPRLRPNWKVLSDKKLLLKRMLLFQVLLAVVFSGIEKVAAGWLHTDQLGILFAYPKGFMVRDWVVSCSWIHNASLTRLMTFATVFVEILSPIGLLIRPITIVSLLVYEVFFTLILVTLEIPPLFYLMFAFGGLLVLDDDMVFRIGRKVQRVAYVVPVKWRRVGG